MSDKLDAATQTEQNAAPIIPQEEPSIANVQVDRQTGRVIYSDGTVGSNVNDIVQYKFHDKSILLEDLRIFISLMSRFWGKKDS